MTHEILIPLISHLGVVKAPQSLIRKLFELGMKLPHPPKTFYFKTIVASCQVFSFRDAMDALTAMKNAGFTPGMMG